MNNNIKIDNQNFDNSNEIRKDIYNIKYEIKKNNENQFKYFENKW